MQKKFSLKSLLIITLVSCFLGNALHARGAGVIPVAWDRGGNIMFLLGHVQNKGYQDFGDKIYDNETEEQGAARNFLTQLNDVFNLKPTAQLANNLTQQHQTPYGYKVYFLPINGNQSFNRIDNFKTAGPINTHLRKFGRRRKVKYVKWFRINELKDQSMLSERGKTVINRAAKANIYGLNALLDEADLEEGEEEYEGEGLPPFRNKRTDNNISVLEWNILHTRPYQKYAKCKKMNSQTRLKNIKHYLKQTSDQQEPDVLIMPEGPPTGSTNNFNVEIASFIARNTCWQPYASKMDKSSSPTMNVLIGLHKNRFDHTTMQYKVINFDGEHMALCMTVFHIPTQKTIGIVGAHFIDTKYRGYNNQKNDAGFDAQAKEIVNFINENQHVTHWIIGGDFNTETVPQPFRNFTNANPRGIKTARSPRDTHQSIDYILTKNLKLIPNTLKIYPQQMNQLLPHHQYANTPNINNFFPSDHAMYSTTFEIDTVGVPPQRPRYTTYEKEEEETEGEEEIDLRIPQTDDPNVLKRQIKTLNQIIDSHKRKIKYRQLTRQQKFMMKPIMETQPSQPHYQDTPKTNNPMLLKKEIKQLNEIIDIYEEQLEKNQK